jgi:N-acetylated-alpha-linked acidic dipeptidase
VRAFGKAVKAGWKPQRTIVFASWDGEEYGLLGSTEWVEEYLPWLSASAVAYINLDVGVSGPNLLVGATPNLDHTIAKILAQVQSPDRTKHGFIQTVNDNWNKKVERLGSGSDFTAFLDHAGVSSIHVGFETGANDPIYHYHSNYDSLHWMDKFGDPGFKYHVTLAQVAVLLAAELVEQPIIPLNATHYVATLRHYLDDLHDRAQAQRFGAQTGMDAHWMANIHDHVKSLIRSLERLGNTTAHFDFAVANLTRVLRDDPDPATLPELFGQARDINLRLKTLERQFLSEDGLVGRKWFKHQIYAPDRKNGYAPLILPAFEEAWGERHLVRKAVETLHQRFAAAQSLLSLHKECKIGDCPPGSVLE